MGEFHLPRYGSGAFRTVLDALFQRTTGQPLQQTLYGKPEKITYDFVEKLIDAQHSNVERIYMVGDNPPADIEGANNAGGRWKSILALTGMHKGPENHPKHPAYHVAQDVAAAFEFMKQDFAQRPSQ